MNRFLFALILILVSPLALAQPATLEQLLQDIRELRSNEQAAMREREAQFLSERDSQQQLMRRAEAELAPIQAEADRLKAEFDRLEQALTDTEAEMKQRSGYLGELFGVVRQTASDTRSQWQDSLLNVQLPERLDRLDQLASASRIPTVETLEQFWFMLQEDMTASGRVSRITAPVIDRDGRQQERSVVLVGPFVALADGQYLGYRPEAGALQVLKRQPSRSPVDDFLAPRTGLADLLVDPTRGTVLAQMQQTPSLMDRVHQGGLVGYVIMALGALGSLLALIKLVWLFRVSARIDRQADQLDTPRDDNPLGRILGVIGDQPRLEDLETLELKLDEAILRETPALERGNALIKLLAAVAPLLGLLGTVTGMIATFQAITLFGTGDPKLMAGGISQALVTTVQGLVVAIPLLFLHATLAARSKALVQVLEQQSAGLIALHLEPGRGAVSEPLWLLRDFLDSGGWVLWAILVVTIVLWTLLVERLWYLWRIFPRRCASLERHWQRRSDRSSVAARYVRQAWLSVARQRLERFMPLIRVLIALCPLLGLLGTVSGMIQVFDVLSIGGTGNPRAMAAGVSRATVPTMAGMVIAISGLFCLARLDAKSRLAMQRLTDRLRHE